MRPLSDSRRSCVIGLVVCLAWLGGPTANGEMPAPLPSGYATAVAGSKPGVYWRFDVDPLPSEGDPRRGAGLEPASGPQPPTFPGLEAGNPALSLPGSGGPEAAGLRLDPPAHDANYSISFWFRNERPVAAKPMTGYLFGRDDPAAPGFVGDNLGIGGTHAPSSPGRLCFFDGDPATLFNGTTDLLPREWYHVCFTRCGEDVAVYLNGRTTPEIHVRRKPRFPAGGGSFTVGIRPDGFGAFAGQVDELVLYDRPLAAAEIRAIYMAAAGREWVPPPNAWRNRVRRELTNLPRPAPQPPNPADGAFVASEPEDVHPIDALLERWWSERELPRPAMCDDHRFVRRIHLDLIGLLPDEDTVRRFLADTAAHKRTTLIDRLLADDGAYAEHWITFWADLLRDDQAAYIAVSRHPITAWLLAALRSNKPYDELVAELLDPRDPAAAGFVRGIEWNLSSSVSELPAMQVAQVTAQVFLGVNLKCVTCHDSFTRDWKLEQSWAFAGYFAPDDLQPYRCDKLHGQPSTPLFLFDGLEDSASGGPLAATADVAARRRAVSILVTRPGNPRFARALVNRLFKKLTGQGLIDATDDLDGRTAFAPALLDRLAYDFMGSDYDLRRLIRTIVTSRVYQMQPADIARPVENPDHEPPFVGPRLRRLTAEQFLDAICCVTDVWPTTPSIPVPVDNPRVRAWRHAKPNTVAVMLGRSNREVVVSDRPDRATMLEALEMVNGEVLAGYLSSGARHILAAGPGRDTDPDRIIDTLALRAYGRSATEEEHAVARELLGPADRPAADRQSGCEDLLWLLVMHPEFHYLY